MPVSEIHHVAVIVSDLERSAQFYQEGLGYRRTLQLVLDSDEMTDTLRLPRGTSGRSVFLQGPSQLGQLELIQWDPPYANNAATPVTDTAKPGIFLLSFAVPEEELPALHATLTALGGTCYTEPRRVVLTGYGPISVFLVEDPDGNLLEMVCFPTRDEVRAHRAELAAANAQ